MNTLELLLFLVVCASIPVVLRIRWNVRELLFAALLLPIFALTITHSTQFLTVDEKAMVEEPVYLATSTLKQWSNGAFRTTDITVGPVMRVVQACADLSEERLKQIAKALHWLFGFIMLAATSVVLARLFIREEEWYFTVLSAGSAMLLPTSAVAFTMCNYDLYSMLLGVLALLCTVAGLRLRNPRIVLCAVIIASFAAQEKLLATPVLWLAACVYIAVRLLDKNASASIASRFIASLRATAIVVVSCAAVLMVSYAILIALRGGALPVEHYGLSPLKITLPFVSPFIMILRGAGGGRLLVFIEETAKQLPALPMWTAMTAAILVAAVMLAMVMALIVHPQVIRFPNRLAPFLRRNLHRVNYSLLAVTFGIGVLSTYLIHGFWAPAHPVAPGHYVPMVGFNGAVLHFGAQTGAGHFLFLFGWAYAVFYNAMPTALVVVALAAGPWRLFRRAPLSLAFELVFFVCLLSPALFAFGQVPLSNRYFNLFILLMLMVTLMRYVPVCARLAPRCRYGVAVFFLALLALELFPFRPSFGLFRPIWSHAPAYEEARPSAGRISPVGHGGGEEVMLAGEKIRRLFAGERLDRLNLYHNFYGAWLGDHHGIRVIDMSDRSARLKYTDSDYYIVDRLSVVQDWLAFPEGIEPEFTIAARGFVHAWVFRGDRLAAGRMEF
ncbi:MAG: hypothetical protein JXA71_04040 [Chitinispirillaceae bacterium]|nr:hypothetical protein [Chitinispirillaceae bacterium]